jgi:Htaa
VDTIDDTVGTAADLELHWPVKRSFIRYVARMTDGQILGGHGVRLRDASTFVFPSESVDDVGVLAFRGEIRLQAHGGALSVRLSDPRVDLRGQRALVTVENPEGSGPPVRLVTFVASSTSDDAGRVTWTGTDVRLAVEALPLFGGYYGEDEPFDDLVIVSAGS